ncbi:anti-sigma-F factor Fin family protein [Bacillus sp. 03113]|uniref:anti-sigma-F factor Fin family protein n=1 Tax=Bacillus sp. 03113 TaxID=2578211 RepID=UPI0011414032|nr:anti-sigma-F factor Fin family protein [Bacillus sp. 03113]
MAIYYHCRHCGVKIGMIDSSYVEIERLGFHKLSDEERKDMISYDGSGNIYIKSICENCQESLQKNPEYYQNDYFIH